MINLQAQELLKNKLLSVKAEFDPEDVQDYFDTIIAPFFYAENIHYFSLLLCSRANQIIVVESSYAKGFLGHTKLYLELLEVVRKFPTNAFKLYIDNAIVSAYSENDLDWIVLKYEPLADDFVEPLLEGFWLPFFDFA